MFNSKKAKKKIDFNQFKPKVLTFNHKIGFTCTQRVARWRTTALWSPARHPVMGTCLLFMATLMFLMAEGTKETKEDDVRGGKKEKKKESQRIREAGSHQRVLGRKSKLYGLIPVQLGALCRWRGRGDILPSTSR